MTLEYMEYNKDITLVQRICLTLREMIRDDTYSMGSKLPNEIELAKMLKVSRGSVRSALQMLEQSGIVVKKRGIGTFVSKEPMLVNNLSMNFGISQVIESTGSKPGTEYTKVYTELLNDPQIAARLEIPENSTMLCISRVRTANGKKVAYTEDIFGLDQFYSLTGAKDIAEVEEYLRENQSLYAYLSARLVKPIHHAISYILPIQCADSEITKLLDITENSVLLKMEQVDYTTNGDPIWMAREYHIPDMFTYSVYRRM